MRIYIAGPYSAPTLEEREQNTRRAIDAAVALVKRGHTPFVPHFTHYIDGGNTGPSGLRYEDFLRWDIEWLHQCETMVFLGSSPGANAEREIARDMQIPIFYDVREVPRAER